MVSTANGGQPPLAPRAGACGVISATSSDHGTTKFISSRNSRLRVLLVLRSKPAAPRLICFMPILSHILWSSTGLCRPSLKLPFISEQTAIATVLSDMDAELAALESRRDKTRALKQGMMQELLTGRIRLV